MAPRRIILAALSAASLLLACASDRDLVLTPDVASSEASRLGGKRVIIYGFVTVSDDFIGVNASEDRESACVGMLIRADKFDAAKAYNRRWVQVTGRLDTRRCTGESFCHDICAPPVILDPTFRVVEPGSGP